MKRLLAILFLLAAFRAQAVLVTATVTVTNVPQTSNSWTVNGDFRYWTNAQSASTMLTNSTGVGPAATNLLSQIQSSPLASVQAAWASTNSITLKASTLVISGPYSNWAQIVFATNGGAITYTLDVPATNVTGLAVRTNNANYLVDYLNLYSVTPVTMNAPALSNYVSIGSAAQTFGNKTIINGIGDGNRLTNIVGLNATVNRLTNGYSTNLTADRIITTNLVNYGNAISSPGSASGAEQHGTGATATNVAALAVGKNSISGGAASTAIGNTSIATGDGSVAVGQDASATGGGANAIGQSSVASGARGVALGNAATVTHADSIVLGSSVSSTTNAQVLLGTSSYRVDIPGILIAATSTNNTFTGTNINRGDISNPFYVNASLANGNNAAILIGTNINILGTGPTAAYTLNGFQNSRDGKEFTFWKTNSLTVTIANDSGVDPTAANRIYTGTGADVTLTNNPGNAVFTYNPTLQRWFLKSKSN